VVISRTARRTYDQKKTPEKLRTAQLFHGSSGERGAVSAHKESRGSAQCSPAAEAGAWELEFNTSLFLRATFK